MKPAKSEERRAKSQKPTSCIVTVDERNNSYDNIAVARLTVGGKIVARASCTSGGKFAALACAAKVFGIHDRHWYTSAVKKITLRDCGESKPGYRVFAAELKSKGGKP